MSTNIKYRGGFIIYESGPASKGIPQPPFLVYITTSVYSVTVEAPKLQIYSQLTFQVCIFFYFTVCLVSSGELHRIFLHPILLFKTFCNIC